MRIGVSFFLQLFTLHLSGAFLLPIDMSRPSTRRRAVEALFLQFISRAKAAFFSLLTYENTVEIPAERLGYQRRFLHLCDFTYFNHTTAFGKAEDISTKMTERRLNLSHGLTFSALERRQCPLWHERCRGGDGEGRI